MSKHRQKSKSVPQDAPQSDLLVGDLRQLIEDARNAAAITVNAELTMLYWKIGKRINEDILGGERAVYGETIVASLSRQLRVEYGNGYSEKNIRRMMQFADAFPNEKIVVTLLRQLSWSHFLALIPLKQPLQRAFYSEMCRVEIWSVRTLRKQIDAMLYERTAISKKPEKLAQQELAKLRGQDRMSPDLVFRDSYVLDFLNLNDTYSERDLESAILRELERFILELGAGFTFVARQKRMVIDSEDHRLDLFFFHRKLKRLVAVDLKLSRFKAAYKGQMELYLRWLEKYEMETDEDSPLGLILCAEGSHETIELLQLDASGIHVAEYLTELPPRDLLERKLHQTIQQARGQIEHREDGEALE